MPAKRRTKKVTKKVNKPRGSEADDCSE